VGWTGQTSYAFRVALYFPKNSGGFAPDGKHINLKNPRVKEIKNQGLI
jgi:hypothetical protein